VLRISLLHATFRAGESALDVRSAWIGRSEVPRRVEHIFALDTDDDISLRATNGHRRVTGAPVEGVTAVRNWNAAAGAAGGDVMFVIADDLLPPQGWDSRLEQLVSPLDPHLAPFAVKVHDNDSKPDDVLLRHPVISRAFYEQLGLWSPLFRGVYCDNELTVRAFWRAFIVDGRSLRLEHRHPEEMDVRWSESQRRLNQGSEYADGSAAFARSWGPVRRKLPVYLVEPGLTLPSATRAARLNRAKSVANGPSYALRQLMKRLRYERGVRTGRGEPGTAK